MVPQPVWSTPGLHLAPAGPLPWVATQQLQFKRARIASPEPASFATPAAQPTSVHIDAAASVGADSARTFTQMTESASLQHSILAEPLQDAKGATSIHQYMGLPWRPHPNPRIKAPPPTEVVRVLRGLAAEAFPVEEILDNFARARAVASVRHTSHTTYLTHLRNICAFCDVLQLPTLPASLQTVRRDTAVCNNQSYAGAGIGMGGGGKKKH